MRNDDWQLAAAVARLYFFKQRSKSEIAEELNISRFRVARLLDAGLEEGVYTIRINDRSRHNTELALVLADRLKINEAIVVTPGDSEESTRLLLAAAAADRLKALVRPGEVIGFSWGRSTLAVSEFLSNLPPVTIVPLSGMVGNRFDQSPIAVLLKVAGGNGVTGRAIFAPMFAPTPEAASALRADEAVAGVLRLHGRMSVAVTSIGSWLADPPISQLVPLMTPEEIADLRAKGVCAELTGIFFDADGNVIDSIVGDRIIIASAKHLQSANVMAVAGTVAKTEAIQAVCRSGMVKTLVTDEDVAHAILG